MNFIFCGNAVFPGFLSSPKTKFADFTKECETFIPLESVLLENVLLAIVNIETNVRF